MKIECSNCNTEFSVDLPSVIGPEGATLGVYRGALNCVYDPENGLIYTKCPECGIVEIDEPVGNDQEG